MQRVLLIASGRVQGVGFREFCCRIASALSLCGYAKNLPDGTVEIVAEGEEKKLAEFRKRVSMRQPLGISVDELEEKKKGRIKSKSFASFSIAY
jgi:acylphosphatase